MAKIIVIQHVPYEPLGTLDPLIRERRHRIRYVNFARDPEAEIDVSRYDALVILGGPMNVGQECEFPHLDKEKALIRAAHNAKLPVLGICLGAQLIASALGGRVYKAPITEIGWTDLSLTEEGRIDPVVSAFNHGHSVFQWHECTFDLPQAGKLLITGEQITNQAFKIGDRTYGFQFHLEANEPLIERWLKLPEHETYLAESHHVKSAQAIREDTHQLIHKARKLSGEVFGAFLDLLPEVKEKHRFQHRSFSLGRLQTLS